LNELHIITNSLGPICHGDSVAGSNGGVGRTLVNITDATRCNQRGFGRKLLHRASLAVEHVSAKAFNIFPVAVNRFALMVLRDEFNRVVMGIDGDILKAFYFFQQSAFYFIARNVFEVENPVVGMSTFFGQIIIAVALFIEPGTVVDQLLNALRAFPNHYFDNVTLVDAITGIHRIFDVFFERISLGPYGRNTPLGVFGVGFVGLYLGNYRD